jgi:hypothetical protein
VEFKPFFIHFSRAVTKHDTNMRRSKPRGFTAYIQPSILPRNVQVGVSFCASADEFTKRIGRELAARAEILACNPRELPTLLAQCANSCGLYAEEKYSEFDYLYVLKYVI